MRDPFREAKAAQAAARFLQLAGGKMNYMLLVKLLYLLDREGLIRWGRPVIYDEYFSMWKGPVVSHVLDLITNNPWPDDQSEWAQFISSPSNYEVTLRGNPNIDDLSEAEEELIEEIFTKFGHRDRFDVVDELHQIIPEWTPVGQGKRVPITIDEILREGNIPQWEITAIKDDLEALKAVRTFLVSH